MKKLLLLLSVCFVPAALTADTMVLHEDPAAGFSIRYPSSWTKTVNQQNVNVDVTAPDGTAKVQVVVQTLDEQVTAAEFLSQMETAMGGRTNLIPEAQRRPPAEQISAAGGDDGAIGAYRIEGNVVVLQGISVMIKGDKVYVLIQTMQDRVRATHGRAVGDIARSFHITQAQ